MRLSSLFAALILTASAAVCSAQESAPPEQPDPDDVIATDRPDFTESALVVRRNQLQIETGFTFLRSSGLSSFGAPEALFRYGVGKKFEWRLGLPNYSSFRAGGQNQAGFGATYLGFKYQIGPVGDDVNISVIPAVFAPTGGRGFNSGDWDPEVKFCFSKSLTDRFGISGMLYAAYPTQPDGRNFFLQQTVTLGYAHNNRWGTFYEFVNTFPERGASQHFFHSGVTYLLNRNTQLDIHFGFGLSREAPDHLIAAGYSVRF
jgi:hypothetical protein